MLSNTVINLLLLCILCVETGKQLFHQVILMSGSDLCEWSYVAPVWNANALTYARDLGRVVGCGYNYDQQNQVLVECLSKKHYEEMVNGTASIIRRVSQLVKQENQYPALDKLTKYDWFYSNCELQNIFSTYGVCINWAAMSSVHEWWLIYVAPSVKLRIMCCSHVLFVYYYIAYPV